MMKRIAFGLLIAAVLFLTGCPAPLITGLPSDLVLVLGRFSPAEGVTQVRGAVGGSIEIPVLITDQTGRAVSGSYDVAFTLSTDADISTTGDNVDAGTQSITAGSETVVTIPVPAAAVAATYTLFGVLDTDDAAENNNLSSISADIGADNLPDLVIDVNSFPSIADHGSTITVGYEIENDGFAKVASGTAFVVRFRVFLSGAYVDFGDDTVRLEQDLNPQERIIRRFDVSVPTLDQMAADEGVTTEEVDRFLVNYEALVDADDAVVEIVEGDTDFFDVMSGNRKPDLVMHDIMMPDGFVAAKPGGAVQLRLEIRNAGTVATGEYGIDLYVDINGDDAYDAGTDFMVKQWAEADTPVVPYDLAGDGNNVIFVNPPADTVYPADIPPGTYGLRAEITTTIEEYDDTDNAVNEDNVLFVENLFNLSMRYMSTTLAAGIDEAAGGDVPITYLLENDGTDPVEADFDVEFYVSADQTLMPTDTLIGTDTVTATVPAGGSIRETYTGAIPGASGAGFYTLYWVLDSGDAVAETDEGDNTIADAEDAYVFPIVTDGATALDTRLVLYKPYGTGGSYKYARVYYYDTPWSSSVTGGGSQTAEGALYGTVTRTLDFGQTGGVRVNGPYSYTSRDVAVSFRIVPDHVTSLPANTIPSTSRGQDAFEPNDTEDTARELSGAVNPLFGFVTVYVDYYSDPNDYFTFDVP